MASQSQLIAAALFFILANKVTSQTDSTIFNFTSSKADSAIFNFTSFSPSTSDLTYQGDAHIPYGTSFVRLVRTITTSPVRPAQNSSGRVLYSSPVAFWVQGRQASFETTFTFLPRINGSAGMGDGLTFFIVPVNSPIPTGSHGGSLGIFNPETGLAPSVFAFEYDYFYNAWDPSYRHIGIDINSRVSRNTTRLPDSFGAEVTATINYDSSTRRITVLCRIGLEIKSVSYVIDLKKILPQQVQVGISGSTGGVASSPELLSWSFSSALVWDSNNGVGDNAENEEEYIKHYV